MAKFFALFASFIFMINFSACAAHEDSKPDILVSAAARSANQNSAPATVSQNLQTAGTPSPAASPFPLPSPNADNVIIDNSNITIIPQQDDRIIITYPKNGINQSDILPSDQSYTMELKPGVYTDPKNAVTTFLFDLYMKQSLCFENIHRDILLETGDKAFLQNLYTMEKLILNLGQADVLVLPKLKYYTNGAPYIYQFAAAYKTTADSVVHFGNATQSDEMQQTSKGAFDMENAALTYQCTTRTQDGKSETTYFEAAKTRGNTFLYRCMNIINGKLQSIYVTVYPEWMQAGYSEGVCTEGFAPSPLSQAPTVTASDKQNQVTPKFSLFANEDGALVTVAENG